MPELKPFEQYFDERYPDPRERAMQGWILAAVRTHKRWGQGKEVSVEEFDHAVAEVTGLQIGGGPPPVSIDDDQTTPH